MRHPFNIEPPLSPLQKEKNQLFSPCGEEKIVYYTHNTGCLAGLDGI
jgi:hypothetical protein